MNLFFYQIRYVSNAIWIKNNFNKLIFADQSQCFYSIIGFIFFHTSEKA